MVKLDPELIGPSATASSQAARRMMEENALRVLSPADYLKLKRSQARPWHVVTIRDRRGWPLDTFCVCPRCWPDYAERLGKFHSSESFPARPEGVECHWCEGECEVPF